MGSSSKLVMSDNSDEESGEAFTDGDFGDSDEDDVTIEHLVDSNSIPVNETMNTEVKTNGETNGVHETDGYKRQHSVSGLNGDTHGLNNNNKGENGVPELRRDSHGDQNASIVGIIGDQHGFVRIVNPTL